MTLASLLLSLFLVMTGCATDHPEPVLNAQSASLSPSSNAVAFNGTLHAIVDRNSDNKRNVGTHPNFPSRGLYPDTIAISTVDFIHLSTSGRGAETIECSVTMGYTVTFDGATSNKVAEFVSGRVNQSFAFIINDQVVTVTKWDEGLTHFGLFVPLTSEYQAQLVRDVVMKSHGR
jgi:hypothetical protein